MGGTDEQHQTLGGGNGSEQPDLQLNLLSVAEQQQHIETKAEADNNASAFAISQEDIDAVLTRGGIVSGGKFRIYEQFLKKESSADNVRMLRDEYGIGGSYPAIYNRDLDESHDSKGLEISCGTIGKPEAKILLTWNKVEKRIGELIAADRFFSAKDKEEYPKYRKDKEARTERSSISEEFKSVVNDFNDYETQLGNEAVVLNQYYMISVANAFYSGEKKYYARTAEGDFALVTMREALQSIISENTHLTKRADKILAELSTAIALPFEPTYDELNPPPEPEKEYRFSLSDTVYIGTQEYEILAYDDNEVHLFDEAFPIFNKVIPRAEFDEKLKENPLNDRLLHIVEDTPGIEPRSDADVFFVDKDSESVIWMYYNPDSTAGGQYVTNTLTFAEIRDVALDTSDRSEFFETLAEIADQELADVGSLWFDEAEADFTDTPTFTGMTEETMNGLIEATKAPELTPWQEYRNIQKTYGGALVLYQVGNFFEVYGAEAVSAAYMLEMAPTKKNMEGHGTVDMFGFPAFTLDENTEKLRGLGYDVVIAPIEVGKRNDYFFASTKEPVQTVDTNIGDMPIEDYREITASQNGFDSYEDMYNQGVRLGNGSDKEPEPVKPAWENNSKRKTKSFDLHPEVPQAERHNFDLAHNEMKTVGKKERFRRNIMAIQLLKKCEDENRFATPDEQIILSKYVGWGGIVEAFDENNSAWATEYLELNAVLNEDEYAAARESTLTAFYTPPVVIRNMYKALENMSFQSGNILEPSCGVGNFLGMLPNSMKSSKLYGIELDSISGRIAGQLYQQSSIAVQGFEKTDLPDSFFDCAIGNVPFGQFKVSDKRYDKNNFLIHDYFFARTLDKVRPGGIIAFVTSKGTMDKENPAVRKYIAQRADMLGAIRLPNDTFKGDAGTEVTSDILFLQKRDRMVNIEPDWVHLNTDENGIRMNQYFVDHPDMVMGEMKMISGQFGPEAACVPYDGASLDEQLNEAIQNIHAEITEYETVSPSEDEEDLSIPADPDVRNFSFTVDDGKIYYRENSRMKPVEVSKTAESRIKGLIAIRDCVRNLIEYQTEDYSDEVIRREQEKLNELYDDFQKKYGIVNSRGNSTAFSEDSSYCLLCSLEVLDDEGNFIRKADMFTKRTIKQKTVIQSVDTASEALAVSLAEKVKIDMPYMCELTGKTEEALFEDLKGVIFLNPLYEYESSNFEKYLTADEYLSGNVREKLADAKSSAKLYPEDYTVNVEALEAVQPKDLTASEIAVRLGATWLPPDIVEEFIFDVFQTPRYSQWNIHVRFSQITGEWNIEGKSSDRGNIKAYNTYGTDRINGYKIIEETLNLRDVRIFDYIEDENGSRKPVLNKKETAIAQGKQELIKQAFADWIWNEPERREKLCRLYNDRFNSNRVREYDGSHLNFVGINPEITLRKHQVDAIARILYGGNTLLAHVVGAGKTFEMVAAAQESKRLGLCQKSLFVVPNHLTEQWASEYLQLYPSANILVATKKDFETKNRKKFCGRIATGDYDAVIIGHTQFEKIPMSVERQQRLIQQQMDELIEGIAEAKRQIGNNFTVKQLEKTRKSLQQKLDKLNDQSRKDDVVTFEELGVDRIFIDEAHYYKNLAAFSKMRNVGGISQTEAQKSADLYMKCRYLDEITGGKGVIFATGTPISNSMVELYTMQKYLQYHTLKRNGLLQFDSWASTFGETVTAIELAPEGTGYRAKTRFARFYNLPELMMMFREVADVQTADMLKLPVPEAHYHNVVLKPTEMQKEMVADLSDRAERVRNRMVDSSVDNMLLITNDGRKLALDQRLMNDMLTDDESSKCSACADNAFEIWQRTADNHGTQMIFCDLSTPHNDGKFNVYDDIRDKLIAKSVPSEEIAYIHTANSEAQKKEMFGKVRSGQIRILLGSTQKMGAGTNVQKKLVALSHLDCPWRPSDLQQREGRIIRQGNDNPEVDIYTFVTENTFDSYLYQLVESKQKFIGQIMTSKSPVRSAEDVDEAALSYAEIKALATGNPHIKEKMDLDIDVSRLKLLKANHLSQKYALEDQIIKEFPQKINACEQRIHGLEADIEYLKTQTHPNEDGFSPMQIEGVTHTDKKEAGTKILEACKAKTQPEATMLGMYRGYTMELAFDTFSREYQIKLSYTLTYTVPLGTDIFGNIQRLDNLLDSLPDKLAAAKEVLENTKTQLVNAKVEVEKPFPKEEELKSKTARLDELNILLNMDKRDNEIVDGEREDSDNDKEPREQCVER
ncbi:MAG: SNF2-related protein [Eubacteriales bacterium]|nr:SNF2-related protein [Eubacteriales bacterium]